MNLNTEYLQKKFGKNIIFKENLSKYSWFNLGGPADIFFRPANLNQLKEFLNETNKHNSNINILGAGSNTLIRDSGVKGIVIKLSSNFSNIKVIEKNIIEVGAATLDRKVSDFAKNNNITEMEFLACIPGSIGGAIIMNSGCYGSDISKILTSIKVLDNSGHEKEIMNEEIKFFYRGSHLPKNLIILSAKLASICSPVRNVTVLFFTYLLSPPLSVCEKLHKLFSYCFPCKMSFICGLYVNDNLAVLHLSPWLYIVS